MLRITTLLFTLFLFPALANAWWNADWSYRKEISLNTSTLTMAADETISNKNVLIRLHTGNFGYFMDVMPKAEDLRFIAADDLTPLKFHIEKFDPTNEMALVWVQIPNISSQSAQPKLWMYYGNPLAVAGEDRNASFDVQQTLVYHFDEMDVVPRDATAYDHDAAIFSAQKNSGSIIGTGAIFDGKSAMVLQEKPALSIEPGKGWTFTTWIMIDQPQDAVLFEQRFVNDKLKLKINGQSVMARLEDGAGNIIETPSNTTLTMGSWHHLSIVIDKSRMALFLDGKQTSYVETSIPVFNGVMTVGNDASGEFGFIGKLDELRISNTARSENWLQLSVNSEGPVAGLITYGEDGQQEGGESEPSYFTTTMQNVTVDGWVVIIVLIVMFAISVVVMAYKAIVITTTMKDNRSFLDKFTELGSNDVDNLDAFDSEEEKEMRESPLMMALSGKHEHFESSNIYRIYHVGVQEMLRRIPKTVGAQATSLVLTSQAIDAIRATMDASMVRENQKLNSLMVLLTIAISGGPFLGLLGTVVGVMITFAAIAASGNVDVNAIAPGIAAALAATVAGLAVAIPALFGYNYLGSRIKEISADMHVFVDEFIAKIAEQHS